MLGDITMGERRYGDAVRELEKAHGLAGDDPRVTARLCKALARVDRADEAMRLIDTALAGGSDSAEVLAAKGWVHFYQGDAAEAAPLLERAVQADPRSADARIGLGRCLQDLGRLDAATAQLEEALILEPGNGDALRLLSLSGKASEGDERLAQVEMASARRRVPTAQRIDLHFATRPPA